jgi:hypothetical protein
MATLPVTVSADTYRRLVNFPLPGGAISGSANPDSSVTFQLDADLHHRLRHIDADVELALRFLMGLRPH